MEVHSWRAGPLKNPSAGHRYVIYSIQQQSCESRSILSIDLPVP